MKQGIDSQDLSLSGRITRRRALQAGIGAAGTLTLSPGLLGRGIEAMAAAVPGPGPYGPLGAPDALGLRLPAGFRSRVIARGLAVVPGTLYPWHIFPDGMGTYATANGGFILVSNSEVPLVGGASAIRFDGAGNIQGAYRILSGTSSNCAGGITPWGTWLSCEETDTGRVWECDPAGVNPAVVRPAMGVFKHEAGCVDPAGKRLYMTEDLGDGCFYRFTPASYPDLSAGLLEVAIVGANGVVSWAQVPDPSAASVPTRSQVPAATRFRRGEGMWFDDGTVYFATTSDDRVYAYEPLSGELEVIYDGVALGSGAPLHDPDNITVSPPSGELFVAEDADDLQLCVITPEGEVAAFAQAAGSDQSGSELTGPAFDPSGTRLYFASQRAGGLGVVYELTGPFRTSRPPKKDTVGPKIKVKVLGKPSLKGLQRHGLPIRVKVSGEQSPPVKVDAILKGPLFKARKARRRGRPIAAAKKRLASGDGKLRLRLRPRETVRRLLAEAGHPLRAKLVVTATDARGNETRKVKRVRFD